MVPNTLIISAFGPYRNTIKIDFEQFKQDGLFLITGPTGSGKTMIFDAITFALYGVSSGSERSSEHFRCDSADISVATYVELDFLLHNDHYIIRRSPKYFIEGRKTPKMPTAILTLPNKKIVDGLKEVNAKINEILGIDEKQFKQIAMIAQGEFTKLIYAGSEEREKVLRNLFKTNDLVYLEEQLKEKVKEYRNKYDLLFSQRNLLEASLELNDQELDYQTYLNELKIKLSSDELVYQNMDNEYNQVSQQLNITNLNNQRIKQLESLQAKLENYLNNQEYYHSLKETILLLKKALEIQKDYQEVKKIQSKIDELLILNGHNKEKLSCTEQELNYVKADYLKIDEYQNKRNNLLLQLQKNKELKETFKDFQKDLANQTNLIKQIKRIKSKLVGLEDKQHKYQKLIESDSSSISKLDKLKSDYELINQEYQKVHHHKLELHKLSDDYDKLLLAEDQGYDLKDEYQKLEDIYLKEKHHYDSIEHHYRLSQAGILARDLKDDQPCPVCGSYQHPRLANLDKDIIYQEDLKKAKQDFDKCCEQRNELYRALILKQQEISILKTQLENDSKRLNINEELDKEVFIKVLGTVNIEENILLKQAKELDNEIIYLNKLKTTLDNHCKDLELVEKEIADYNYTLNNYNDQLNQLMGKIKPLEYLKQLTELQIDQKIYDNEKELKDLELLIVKIENDYRDLKEKTIQIETNVELISKQLVEEQNNYQDKLKVYLDKLGQSFSDEKTFIDLLTQINMINEKEKEYNDYLIVTATLHNQISELKEELADIKYVDISILKESTKKLKIELEELQDSLNKQKAKLITVTNTINNIREIDEQLNDSYDIYQQYLDLSEITTGKNEYRISFERYVLAAYFENILAYSNILLKRMSLGRYQLYRRDNRSKGSAKQGLELDVLDLESGMLRDVKTLSGGESFKAALSLALGLSKMIQSFAGGIELNTLFIDEGFGSLDSQSLDQAIDCLMDIQQDGKLIGIISHVSELKERIDHKIVLSRVNKETYISIE
ncbi:AAA family ATPase [Thomasclavelia cocleata]|uniref:AAA family ATPase n=1 Tax=Thomasclavelia cocleata TaxID=69824 RepID=UPI00272EC2F8|nr:AAA family ATPase [Thomasclavelia cocleata]